MIRSYEIDRGNEHDIYITIDCGSTQKGDSHNGSGLLVPVYRVKKPPFKCEEPTVIIDGIKWPNFILHADNHKIDK